MKTLLQTSLLVLAVVLCARLSARAEETKRYLVAFESWAGAADKTRALKSVGAKAVENLDALDAAVVEVPAAQVTNFTEAASMNPAFGAIEEDVYVANWLVSAQPSFYNTALPGVGETLLVVKPQAADAAPQQGGPWADHAEFPWGIRRVNAQAAWSRSMGDGARIAVIDTGIDANHPDLKGQVVGGYNAVDSDKPWFDDNSHGSHVSGTIAGSLDGKGVVGVAPKARLYAVKVLNASGGANLSSIIKGLVWCANNKIQAANMSLGSPIGSVFMKLAAKYATSKGVVLIAAAGNNGGAVGYPAGFDDVIAVSASDSSDRLAKFSSRGKKVEFIAPGVDVKSSLPGGLWDEYSGTSMATPHVTGLAALALGRGIPASSVRAELKRAARSIGLPKTEEGHGMIDAAILVK